MVGSYQMDYICIILQWYKSLQIAFHLFLTFLNIFTIIVKNPYTALCVTIYLHILVFDSCSLGLVLITFCHEIPLCIRMISITQQWQILSSSTCEICSFIFRANTCVGADRALHRANMTSMSITRNESWSHLIYLHQRQTSFVAVLHIYTQSV